MKQPKQLTCIIEREGEGYVSLCPQYRYCQSRRLRRRSQKNLIEAIELFFEMASPQEILARMYSEIYVTQIEVAIG